MKISPKMYNPGYKLILIRLYLNNRPKNNKITSINKWTLIQGHQLTILSCKG